MTRVAMFATAFLCLAAPLPRGPAAPPASLAEAGDSARSAWQRRDLAAFLAPAVGGRLLVTLPPAGQSAPITAEQARALLASYVQGTEEVTTVMRRAQVVDSLQGYVQLGRRFRLVGIPEERESTILLGFRRGRSIWVLTEVRMAP
jgi:hypothetical protein